MNSTLKSILLWFFAFLLTVGLAYYQRKTGPTYPVDGQVNIENTIIKYKLPRSAEVGEDARVKFLIPDTTIKGELQYRRFKSYDRWDTIPLVRSGDTLVASVPQQPAAGKVMYHITFIRGEYRFNINENAVVIRFKGKVPWGILWPHIITIFLAMLLSARTGLEVIFKGKSTYLYTWMTVVMLFIGGLVMGPIVQKYAFDAYWTGWPFGNDLTDNKSLIAFIFWLFALIIIKKNRENKLWPVIASIVMLVVFLIPHSILGSEIDFTKEQDVNTMQKE